MNLFRKFISLTTIVCFFYSFILTPVIEATITPQLGYCAATPNLENSLIPSNLGSITSSKDFKSDISVITIQDLHCNAEVQKNISKILRTLDEKYGLTTVYVEGGNGDIDTSWLESLSNERIRKNIAEALVDSGRLTGSEYYSITTNKPHLLKGLEVEKLHKENILRLGRIIEHKKLFEESVKKLDDDIALLKARYLNRKNDKLNTLIEQYKDHVISSQKYYKLLQKYICVINDRPDEYNALFKIRLTNYPNTVTYLELLNLEPRLNSSLLTRDLHNFIEELKSVLPYRTYNNLITQTDNFKNSSKLYELLSTIAIDRKIDVSKSHPELKKFFTYLEMRKGINPVELVREEKRLIEELRIAFSSDVNEVDVSFLIDFYSTFKDYLFNRLSANDYDYFVSRFDKFKTIWSKYTYCNHLKELETEFPLLDAYYRVNNERTDRFVENILKTNSSKIVVMVTGGFHSEGLQKLLDERKISHLTITPNIVNDTAHSRDLYQVIVKEQAALFSRQALSHRLFSQMAPQMWATDKGIRMEFSTGESVLFSKEGTLVRMVGPHSNSITAPPSSQELNSAVRYGSETAVKDVFGQISLLKEIFNPIDLAPGTYYAMVMMIYFLSHKGWLPIEGLSWDIAHSDHQTQEYILSVLAEEIGKNASLDELAGFPPSVQNAIVDHVQRIKDITRKIPTSRNWILSVNTLYNLIITLNSNLEYRETRDRKIFTQQHMGQENGLGRSLMILLLSWIRVPKLNIMFHDWWNKKYWGTPRMLSNENPKNEIEILQHDWNSPLYETRKKAATRLIKVAYENSTQHDIVTQVIDIFMGSLSLTNEYVRQQAITALIQLLMSGIDLGTHRNTIVETLHTMLRSNGYHFNRRLIAEQLPAAVMSTSLYNTTLLLELVGTLGEILSDGSLRAEAENTLLTMASHKDMPETVVHHVILQFINDLTNTSDAYTKKLDMAALVKIALEQKGHTAIARPVAEALIHTLKTSEKNDFYTPQVHQDAVSALVQIIMGDVDPGTQRDRILDALQEVLLKEGEVYTVRNFVAHQLSAIIIAKSLNNSTGIKLVEALGSAQSDDFVNAEAADALYTVATHSAIPAAIVGRAISMLAHNFTMDVYNEKTDNDPNHLIKIAHKYKSNAKIIGLVVDTFMQVLQPPYSNDRTFRKVQQRKVAIKALENIAKSDIDIETHMDNILDTLEKVLLNGNEDYLVRRLVADQLSSVVISHGAARSSRATHVTMAERVSPVIDAYMQILRTPGTAVDTVTLRNDAVSALARIAMSDIDLGTKREIIIETLHTILFDYNKDEDFSTRSFRSLLARKLSVIVINKSIKDGTIPQTVETLGETLFDPDQHIREYAAEGLYKIATYDHMPHAIVLEVLSRFDNAFHNAPPDNMLETINALSMIASSPGMKQEIVSLIVELFAQIPRHLISVTSYSLAQSGSLTYRNIYDLITVLKRLSTSFSLEHVQPQQAFPRSLEVFKQSLGQAEQAKARNTPRLIEGGLDDLFYRMNIFNPTYVTTWGRKVIYQYVTKEGIQYISLKMLKQDEADKDPEILYKEFNTLDALRGAGTSLGEKLEVTFAEPLGVYEIDIPEQQRPSKTGTSPSLKVRREKGASYVTALVLKETRETLSYSDGGETGRWIGTVNTVNDKDTHTDGDILTEDEVNEGSRKGIHDLFLLLKNGIVHPDLIYLFHDDRPASQRGPRGDDGWYILEDGGRIAAPLLKAMFSNLRPSGFADTPNLTTLDEIRRGSREYFKNIDLEGKSDREIVQHYMAEYWLAFALVRLAWMDKTGELTWKGDKGNNVDILQEYMHTMFRQSLQTFFGFQDAEIASILQPIDWTLMARQMIYFVSGEYAKDLPRAAEGRIVAQKIKDTSITRSQITADTQRSLIAYQRLQSFFPDATLDIPTRQELIDESKGFGGYRTRNEQWIGWALNGRDRDLGSPNGKMPLTALWQAMMLVPALSIAKYQHPRIKPGIVERVKIFGKEFKLIVDHILLMRKLPKELHALLFDMQGNTVTREQAMTLMRDYIYSNPPSNAKALGTLKADVKHIEKGIEHELIKVETVFMEDQWVTLHSLSERGEAYVKSHTKVLNKLLSASLIENLSLIVFTAFSFLKILIGHATRQVAMVADGTENLTDSICTFLVIAGIYTGKTYASLKKWVEYGVTGAQLLIMSAAVINIVLNTLPQLAVAAPVHITFSAIALVLASMILSAAVSTHEYKVGMYTHDFSIITTAADKGNNVIQNVAVLAGMAFSAIGASFGIPILYHAEPILSLVIASIVIFSIIKLTIQLYQKIKSGDTEDEITTSHFIVTPYERYSKPLLFKRWLILHMNEWQSQDIVITKEMIKDDFARDFITHKPLKLAVVDFFKGLPIQMEMADFDHFIDLMIKRNILHEVGGSYELDENYVDYDAVPSPHTLQAGFYPQENYPPAKKKESRYLQSAFSGKPWFLSRPNQWPLTIYLVNIRHAYDSLRSAQTKSNVKPLVAYGLAALFLISIFAGHGVFLPVVGGLATSAIAYYIIAYILDPLARYLNRDRETSYPLAILAEPDGLGLDAAAQATLRQGYIPVKMQSVSKEMKQDEQKMKRLRPFGGIKGVWTDVEHNVITIYIEINDGETFEQKAADVISMIKGYANVQGARGPVRVIYDESDGKADVHKIVVFDYTRGTLKFKGWKETNIEREKGIFASWESTVMAHNAEWVASAAEIGIERSYVPALLDIPHFNQSLFFSEHDLLTNVPENFKTLHSRGAKVYVTVSGTDNVRDRTRTLITTYQVDGIIFTDADAETVEEIAHTYPDVVVAGRNSHGKARKYQDIILGESGFQERIRSVEAETIVHVHIGQRYSAEDLQALNSLPASSVRVFNLDELRKNIPTDPSDAMVYGAHVLEQYFTPQTPQEKGYYRRKLAYALEMSAFETYSPDELKAVIGRLESGKKNVQNLIDFDKNKKIFDAVRLLALRESDSPLRQVLLDAVIERVRSRNELALSSKPDDLKNSEMRMTFGAMVAQRAAYKPAQQKAPNSTVMMQFTTMIEKGDTPVKLQRALYDELKTQKQHAAGTEVEEQSLAVSTIIELIKLYGERDNSLHAETSGPSVRMDATKAILEAA
ncbi:MAG: hypothetical protein ABSH12_00560 [Endomicrobiales bacterium]